MTLADLHQTCSAVRITPEPHKLSKFQGHTIAAFRISKKRSSQVSSSTFSQRRASNVSSSIPMNMADRILLTRWRYICDESDGDFGTWPRVCHIFSYVFSNLFGNTSKSTVDHIWQYISNGEPYSEFGSYVAIYFIAQCKMLKN